MTYHITSTSKYLDAEYDYRIEAADEVNALNDLLSELDSEYPEGDFGVEDDPTTGESYIYSNRYTEQFDLRDGDHLIDFEIEEA